MNSSGPSGSRIAVRRILSRAAASWQRPKPAPVPPAEAGSDEAAEHDLAPKPDGQGKLVDKIA
jgi:hypothetical protein